ncbi:MAG TPA: alpha/beta hydrolase [Blastocatellia bacterium]
MPKVLSNGVSLWYNVTGTGMPIVTIGGFGLLHNQWDSVNPYLEKHHRVVNWNYRGSGKSDWTMSEPFTVEQFVEDLRAVLDDAGIDKTTIWGTGTGSPIGIRFAAKYSDRVHALITYPWFRCDETWKDIFRVSYEIARTFGLLSLGRVHAGVTLPRDVLYAKEGLEFEHLEIKYYETNLNPRTLDSLMAAFSNVDLTSDVARLRCPTLLLMGNESQLINEQSLKSASFSALVQGFKELKPDVEVAAVAGASTTACVVTRPKESAEIVLDYLRRING